MKIEWELLRDLLDNDGCMKLAPILFLLVSTPIFAGEVNIYEKLKELEERIEKLEKLDEDVFNVEPLYIGTSTGTLIQFVEKINLEIYCCLRCGKTFRDTNQETQCAVIHQPGDCCHYGDEEIR